MTDQTQVVSLSSPSFQRIFLLVAGLLGGLQAHGQQPPSLRFEHLTLEDGLSHSTVEDIVQGPHGFLWFGTTDGLNRYDGSSFRTYRHRSGDTTSLSSSTIETLLVGREGRLWVGTQNGLNRYDPSTDEFIRYALFSSAANTKQNWIHDLEVDREGRLWIATLGGGLGRLNPETDSFTTYRHRPADPHSQDNNQSLSSNYVWAIEVDRRGYVWVGTSQNGLNRLDPNTGTITPFTAEATSTPGLCSNQIRGLHEDRQGRLWIGTRGGLSRLDSTRSTSTSYCPDAQSADPPHLSSPNVDDLYEDRQGRLWVATDGGGLNLYDPSIDGFVHYRSDPADPYSLSSDVVRSIYQDRCGDLWIGNFIGGVNHFNTNNTAFRLYQHRPGDPSSLSHNAVLAFHEDDRGNVWIGTDGGGLNYFDPATESFTHYTHNPNDPNSLSGNKVIAVIQDRNGIVWAGTSFGGLNRYNPQTDRFTHFKADPDDSTSLSTNSVWDLYEDDEGRLWVGTYDGGLDRLHRDTGVFEHYSPRPDDSTSLVNNRVTAIFEDSKSRLWVGTEGGLSRMVEAENGSISFVNYRSEAGPPSSLTENWILALHEDDEGRLWIGTHGGGLNRLDPDTGTFRAYQSDDGLSGGIVYGILEDDDGDLWMSTSEGLSEFDPDTETFTTYDDAYRLQPGLFNRPNAYLKHSSGSLFFGGTKGFNVFRPNDIHPNTCEPPVHLTDIHVMHDPAPVGPDAPLRRHALVADSLRLQPNQSVVSFEFAALNYRMPGKNRYKYKLAGFDETWRHVEHRHRATYTNLDAGTYTFRVRGSNNSGRWSSQEASLTVTVLPPFWKTWWFYGGVALLLIVGLVGFHRYRLSHIQRHNELLEKRLSEREVYEKRLVAAKERAEEMHRLKSAFLANMSHEIRTPLTAIIGFAEMLKDEFKPEFAARIADSANRLKRTLDSVLQLSQLESGSYDLQIKTVDVIALVREQINMLQSRAQEKGVSVRLDASAPTIEAQTDARCLERIVSNLLSNAIKFTDEGEVRVEVEEKESTFRLTVHDTGEGIDSAFLDDVFDVFTQESSGRDRSHEGTGLGLPVTKRLVTVLGGDIDIESEKGVGTTVMVRLPRTQEAMQPERPIPTLQGM